MSRNNVEMKLLSFWRGLCENVLHKYIALSVRGGVGIMYLPVVFGFQDLLKDTRKANMDVTKIEV